MTKLISIALIQKAILALPKAIVTAAEFKDLFDKMLVAFSPTQQSQLKTAYQQAREGSDSAQADFQKASRGE
jgi:hypothetical protein